MTTWDAIVCGAGAAGLATARALGGLGLRTLVLDRQHHRPAIAKGEVLQPGALRVLGHWGITDRLTTAGAVPLARLTIRGPDADPLMLFDYTTLPAGYRTLYSHDHTTILTTLARALPPHVELRRGALADTLLHDTTGRVTGVRVRQGRDTHDLRAPLVVAADGMSSRLRRAAGITVHPRTYPHRLIAFDLPGAPPEPEDITAYRTPRGLRLVYPLPHGRTRLYCQIHPDEIRGADRAAMTHWATALDHDTPALRTLTERVTGSLASRQVFALRHYTAPTLTVPGLALVGEAAHAVHSLAAQGMNTAICDAHALAHHLATAPGPDAALAAYQAERLPWIRHIAVMSHDAARLVTATGRTARALGRRALRRTHRSPRLRYTATYNLAGLGIHPFAPLDRLHQLGLPDPRSGRLPHWHPG
ncbi:FAD-dependent oxidoreductase [Streptomyces ginkgonis]|uniref:FAD-dependent oxidoreductase n=1 Tax=Streptomyces ginkgonis TaxID=1812259 RepID=UPI002176E9AC|nr:NAD(P)/FAD-dependent oxidoreductase [Streptomyces ginkgonis]